MSDKLSGNEGEVRAIQKGFLAVSPHCRLIRGAKFSLVIDLETGGLHRVNSSASEILRLSKQGLSIQEILDKTRIDSVSAAAFIREMKSKGLITLQHKPEVEREVHLNNTGQTPLAELHSIWIEVTSRCNLRCIHCYADDRESEVFEPSIKKLFDWLSQASALGCRRVQFTGGECTLRKDIRDYIRHAQDIGFEHIEVFTNGTNLTESLIRFFAENKINVALSLYSFNAKSHDAISGIPGSHRMTLNSLKQLLAYEVPLRGSIIAMKQNEKELQSTQKFLQELGVPSGPADPVRPCGRGTSLKHWPEKYGLSFMRTKPQFMVDNSSFQKNLHWNSCWFGKAAITAKGKVIPCVFARDQVAGDLYKESLESIVFGPLLDYWGLTHDKISTCRDCEYRYLCNDCRPWAYGYTGDLFAKTPICTYDPYEGKWGPSEIALTNERSAVTSSD